MWFASYGFYPHQLAPELCSYLGLMTKKLDDSKCDDGKIIGQVLKSEFHQLQPKKKKKKHLQRLRELQQAFATLLLGNYPITMLINLF